MKKYFIVADVHGYFDEMMHALKLAKFSKKNPDHIFVSLGDIIDRGPKVKECIEFVNSLPENRKILIRGNHEDMLDSAILRRDLYWSDYQNGMVETIKQLTGEVLDWVAITKMRTCGSYKKYTESLLDYYELGDNIFVHSWIPFNENRSLNENLRYGDWDSARWTNGYKAWTEHPIAGKTLYVGHWHTSWAHKYIHNDGEEFGKNANFGPFVDRGIVGLDACTAISKQVNCYIIEGD